MSDVSQDPDQLDKFSDELKRIYSMLGRYLPGDSTEEFIEYLKASDHPLHSFLLWMFVSRVWAIYHSGRPMLSHDIEERFICALISKGAELGIGAHTGRVHGNTKWDDMPDEVDKRRMITCWRKHAKVIRMLHEEHQGASTGKLASLLNNIKMAGPNRNLSKKFIGDVKVVYKVLGPYLDITLEEFYDDFRRDGDPDAELSMWFVVAHVWVLYHDRYMNGIAMESDEDEKLFVDALLTITAGTKSSKEFGDMLPDCVDIGELVLCVGEVRDELDQQFNDTQHSGRPMSGSAEKPRCDFWEWETAYHLHKQATKSNRKYKPPPEPAYYNDILRKSMELPRSKQNNIDTANLRSEIAWVRGGRPYYKVWPAMLDMLLESKLNIGCNYINMPFEQFVLRFPKESSSIKNSPRSALVTVIRRATFGKDRRDMVMVCWRDETDYPGRPGGSVPSMSYANFPIESEYTIDDTIEKIVSVDTPSNDPETVEGVMRVAMSATFFAVNNHEIIRPDIPRRLIEKHAKAVECGDEGARKRYESKNNGWHLGADILTPKPIVVGENGSSDTNGESKRRLEFSHPRTGFMGLRACGPGRSRRVMTFIRPTIVRPDRPLGPTRGRGVKQP